jgi:single-strand DNA-binding protein
MSGLNKATLIGNLTRDPELKTTASGMQICKFSLAINERGKGGETTLFLDVTCFGQLADIVGQYCSKGKQVYVDGRIAVEQWEGKDGQKRTKTGVIADRVIFLGRGDDLRDDKPSPPTKQQMPVYQDPLPTSEINHDDIPF